MPAVKHVRPQFRREPRERIELTERDVAIISAVAKHRFLRSSHIFDLFGEGRSIKRLRALYHHGFLDRPRAQLSYFHRAGSEPRVYALGNKGADLLALHSGLPRARVDWTNKNRDVGQLFIRHTLAIADVMVALECACRGRNDLSLLEPTELLERTPAYPHPAPFKLSADVVHDGTMTPLALVPDKTFALRRVGEEPKLFFLEADRATMPIRRTHLSQTSFFRKLLTYHAFARERGERARFAIGNFRVLTVTTTPERIASMIEAVSELGGGRGRFLFADQATLACHRADVLSTPWLNGRNERVQLV